MGEGKKSGVCWREEVDGMFAGASPWAEDEGDLGGCGGGEVMIASDGGLDVAGGDDEGGGAETSAKIGSGSVFGNLGLGLPIEGSITHGR